MQEVTLYIETPDGQRTVKLDNEISIGRTDLAQLVVNDPSLSRLHATIFREGDDVWILDENSSNGSFVNGQKVSPERKLRDGDEIQLGSNTRIYVEIQQPSTATRPQAANTRGQSSVTPQPSSAPPKPQPAAQPAQQKTSLPLIPIIGAAAAFFIIIFAVIAIALLRNTDKPAVKNGKPTPSMPTGAVIPIRVIDPLGGEDPDELDDFISSWEGEEEELKAENIEEIKVETTGDPTKRTDLIVSRAFWEQQRAKSLGGAGASQGLSIPPEMSGRGFGNQLRKVAQLRDRGGYKIPLDFSDLAESYLRGTLVELPIATQTYVLDVGGSATEAEFTEFDFDRGNLPIAPSSAKYNVLKQLADKLGYSLTNPAHRRQMRMRLLRMYNPNSRKILEALCQAFYERFKVPLRITSLTRSMDYQISLNKTNGNSYRVRDRNATPPHTSGCAFDIGRNHLSGEAQNFLMSKFAELERVDKIDSLIEGNVNACFHTFIYPDGVGPNKTVAVQPAKTTVTQPQKPQPPKQTPKVGK
jgi:hypothetical protein